MEMRRRVSAKMSAKSRHSVVIGTAAMAVFTGLHALGTDYYRNIANPSGNEWWTPGTWLPSDWANGAANAAAVTNTAAAATDITLAQPVVASAFAFRGGASTTLKPVTPASPETFTLTGSSQVLNISFASAANEFVFETPFIGGDVTAYSVGTGPAGSGSTGGVAFEGGVAPVWSALRMKSGHFLMREMASHYALYPLYSGTVILDGGGICTRNYGAANTGSGIINFPVRVSPAGGWWRTYGNGVLWYNGVLSDEIPGSPGVFRHTDGGTFYITNTLAGFSGTLRNEAGTLVLTGTAARDFSGTIEQAAGAAFAIGNADNLNGASVSLPCAAISAAAGSVRTYFDNGTVAIPCPVNLASYFDVRGSSTVRLTGNLNRTFTAQMYDIGGGLELVEGSITAPAGTALLGFNTAASKAVIQHPGTLWRGGAVSISAGELRLLAGAVQTNAYLTLVTANNASHICAVVISGGTMVCTNAVTAINSSDSNVASPFRIGYWPAGNARVIIDNGGELDARDGGINITWDAAYGGVFVSNGTLRAHGIQVGVPTKGGTAELQMEAGAIIVGAGGIIRRESNAAVALNGGTLAGTAPFTVAAPFTVGGTVTVDTAGGNITQTGGAITGPGTLRVTGGNTFAVSNVQVAVELAAGKLLPAEKAISLPAIETTSADSALGIQLAATTSGASTRYTASGNITLADGTQFDITLLDGAYADGQPYALMETTGGTITVNDLATLRAPLFEQARATVAFTLSGNGRQLLMTVTKVDATLYWKAPGASGTWDTNAVAWSQNPAAPVADEAFRALDRVVFNDVPLQPSVTVAIPATVTPAQVTVANTATDFTLTGAGVTGGASLTKSGAGALTFDAPWGSGPVTLNGGLLDWRSPGTFAPTLFTVASGTTFKLNHPSATVTASAANLWSGANLYLGSGTLTAGNQSHLGSLGTVTLSNGTLVVSGGTTLTKGITLDGGTTGRLDVRDLTTGTTANAMTGKITGTGGLTLAARGSTADSGGSDGSNLHLNNAANDFTGAITLVTGMTRADSNFGNPDNPIILNGGGIVWSQTTPGGITMNRDLFIGPNGGYLRSYGTASPHIWAKRFADLVPGTAGTVSHTDGGPLRFTGDISGFTGAFRKANSSANAITTIGDGGLLPCDEMRWKSIAVNGQSVIFDFTNETFRAGFSTSGSGAIRKRGTSALVFTNYTEGAIAHTGGTYIEAGRVEVGDLNHFENNASRVVDIAAGATLEQRPRAGLPSTGNRKVQGAGTLKITLTSEGGNPFYNGSGAMTGFTGTLDLYCTGGAKLRDFPPARMAPGATLKINSGALFYASSTGNFPYNLKIAGNGNTEVSTGFGAIRSDNAANTFSGSVALIDNARLYGNSTYTGPLSNECATAKTLSIGGTYSTGWTLNLNGRLTDGCAPLSLALTHNDTLNLGGTNCISGALTVAAGTVNITAGSTQVGNITNNTAITVASGATLLTSGTGTGAGAYTFGANSVLGFACVMGGDGTPTLPHLTAQTLTFPGTAKITVTGIGLIENNKAFYAGRPVFTFPTAAIVGIPALTEPLPTAWAITRRENGNGTASLLLGKRTGTVILLR